MSDLRVLGAAPAFVFATRDGWLRAEASFFGRQDVMSLDMPWLGLTGRVCITVGYLAFLSFAALTSLSSI